MKHILLQALDLDYRLSNHYQVNWDDIPADVYHAHRVIVDERNRKQREDDQKTNSKLKAAIH